MTPPNLDDELDLEAPPTRARHRRQRFDEPLVNLTSMVDVLAVLMFFLLTMYSGGGYLTVLPSGLSLPNSDVRANLSRNLEVAVLPDRILVDREEVGDDPVAIGESEELLVPGLHAVLENGVSETVDEDVRVTVLADREIPFRVLKKVLYTLDQAGFQHHSLAVRQVTG